MSARNAGIRKMTAREAAEKLGVSERHIRRVVAEPREQYLARAAERRNAVLGLREQGRKHREIAAELGISIGTVSRILWQAKHAAAATGDLIQSAV